MVSQDELILPESLLLLSLDDATGTVRNGNFLNTGLTLAALFELYLRGHLRCVPAPETNLLVQEARALFESTISSQSSSPYPNPDLVHTLVLWQVTDFSPVGHPFLDAVLETLRQQSHPEARLPLASFARAFQSYKPAEVGLCDLAAHRLIARGILTVGERRRMGGLFREKLLPEESHTEEEAVVIRLKSIILGNQAPEERDIALLALVRACGLLSVVFEKGAERDKIEWRITQLIRRTKDPSNPLSGLANAIERH